VRKSPSQQRLASVSNLCNSRSQGAGNMGNKERRSGFGKSVCPPRATREEREPERPQTPQKDLDRRNAGAEERRARAGRESAGKRADYAKC